MNTIVPIDSTKIVEILFENSEKIPENDYVFFMNLMKQYHEDGDNEEEIKDFINLKIIDTELKNKINNYIVKKPKKNYFKFLLVSSCNCFCNCFGYCFGCSVIVGFYLIMELSLQVGFIRGNFQNYSTQCFNNLTVC